MSEYDDEPPAVVKPPESFAEMRDEFMLLIWQQRATLKGVALVQALNSLAKLADVDNTPAEISPEVDVLDLIENDGLLPERKRALLGAERLLVAARLGRIDTELEKL